MTDDKTDDVSSRKLAHLKKMASTNFARFAIQVEHMSAEVQMKLIEQLPEFQKLATGALDKLSEAHRATLDSMQAAEGHLDQGFEDWRKSLIAILDDSALSLEEKLRVTAEIGRTVREQAAVQADNNKARAALLKSVVWGSVVVIGAVVVAVTGGKIGVDQSDKNA